jgi:coenzyme F420-reducing hydrogenase beta subunit
MRWDKNGFLKPHGPPDWLERRSPAFSRQCPFSPAAENEDAIASRHFAHVAHSDPAIGRFEAAYVGAVAERGFRKQGSSGGLTNWVAAELLRTGAVDGVAHVAPVDPATGRFFEYRISRSPDDLGAGAKSRYYPIELSAVLRQIRSAPGRYAIVGVPCFIKAIRLLQADDATIRERITHTLGLFCGHMKSAAMVESFAWQLGTEIKAVRLLDYRVKDETRPANWYRAHLDLTDGSAREQDWWHLADGDWGAGFFQNPACDWVEPHSSDGRGTNVVIARTAAMKALLERGRATGAIELEPVPADFVIATQAAGLRHRREGLAYRLSWHSHRLRPRKRVAPSANFPLRRKLVFRMRFHIAKWSHRMFRFARAIHAPRTYLGWARSMLRLYQAVAWSRGRFGGALDRLLPNERR